MEFLAARSIAAAVKPDADTMIPLAAWRATKDSSRALTALKDTRACSRARLLRLSRGHAYFNVAHDVLRPFRVHTPVAIIQAVGTRFSVELHGDETVVTVIEGSVEVARSMLQTMAIDPEQTPTIRLSAAQQLRVSPRRLLRVAHTEGDDALAWATVIHFDRVLLHEAIEQFAQRSGVSMKLADTTSGSTTRLSGVYQLDTPESFALYMAMVTKAPVSLQRPGRASRTIMHACAASYHAMNPLSRSEDDVAATSSRHAR